MKIYVIQEVHADIDKVIAVVHENEFQQYMEQRTQHYMDSLLDHISKSAPHIVASGPKAFHHSGELGSFGVESSIQFAEDVPDDNGYSHPLKFYAFYTEMELWKPE